MKNMERDRLTESAPKAEAQQKIRQRERIEKRTMQIAANAEVRRRWIESDAMLEELALAERNDPSAEQAGSD